MNQAQQLAAEVSRSIVSVEWMAKRRSRNATSVLCAGSVLHKSANHTYILTFFLKNPRHFDLLVRFHDHDQGEIAAVSISGIRVVGDAKLPFIVLRMEGIRESSIPIQFRDEPMKFSNALCVVPKTKSIFHKILGFIPTPSCASNDMTGNIPEITNDHFIFVCAPQDTETMKSAPVFHENGQVNGFVIEDCSLPFARGDKPGDKFIDREAKICVKPRHLEAWLRQVSGDNDWRAGLEKMKG